MSVLINMEMPQNCFDCPCYHHKVDDGYYDYEICRASGTVFNDGYASVTGHKTHIDPFKERLDNCPLVPIPEHGRLIDADALEYHADNVRDPMGRTEKTVMWRKIQSAPTIIPAEEGE